MARKCSGHRCPYGYGHHDEHVEAAKLGWRRRKQGEAKYIGHVFGGQYEIHRHHEHFMLRSEADDSHFELTRQEYRELVAQMRAERREADTERKYQAELQRIARIVARENAPKQATLREGRDRLAELQRAKRDAERLQKQRDREIAEEQRMRRTFERDQLYAAIRESGSRGIRPHAKVQGEKRARLHEEFQAVPRHLRASARDTHAMTADDLAAHLSDNAPWLNIHSENDLYEAFNRLAFQRHFKQTV